MKIHNIKISCVLFLSLLFACDSQEPIPTVELPQFMQLSLTAAFSNPNEINVNLASGRDTTFSFVMKYGGVNDYHQGDISAQIGVDAASVAAFNAENATDYLLLPQSAYSLNKTTLTISDGANISDVLTLTVKTSAVDFLNEYVLPLTMTSVSGALPANEQNKTAFIVIKADVEEEAGIERWTKVNASSEWQAPYVVSKAFDEDVTTYWHTDLTGLPQWFTVDMNGYKRIDGFTYNNRKDAGQNSLPKHLTVEVSIDGVKWVTALDIAEVPQSRLRQVFPLDKTLIARYFKVTVHNSWTGDPYSYLAEIGIYAGEPPAEDQAFELSVHSYSSFWAANWEATRLIDGDKGTTWHSALTGLPQWVIFDVTKSRQIKGVKIWNRQDDHGMEPKHISFEVSDDLTTWTQLLDVAEMSQEWKEQLDLKAPTPQTGRYLRMMIHTNWSGNPWTALGEVTPY